MEINKLYCAAKYVTYVRDYIQCPLVWNLKHDYSHSIDHCIVRKM